MFREYGFVQPLDLTGRGSPDLGRVAVEIIRPREGKLRSRTVVSRGRTQGTQKFPSWKTGRMMQSESPHELNALRLLDAESTVRAFYEQPFAIRYTVEEESHLHYPDILVEWRNGCRELWEVKPASDAIRPDVYARTRLLESALPRLGFDYRMVTGEELEREPRLSNAKAVRWHGRKPIGDHDRERIRQLLLRVPSLQWVSAENGDLGSQGRSILCRLVLEGVLTFDVNQKLAPTTLFMQSDLSK